jgi:WD40 repeat protein
VQILKGHNSAKPVRSLAFSPDGQHLGSSARDYQTRLWDLNTSTSIVVEEGWANSYTVAFSPDGAVVATGKTDSITLYSIATRQVQRLDADYDGMAMQVGYSPDGKFLAAVGGTLRLWTADTLKAVPVPQESLGAHGCLAIRRDSTLLASAHTAAGHRHAIRLWDLATLRMTGELSGHTAETDAICFSPDGRLLAAACARTLYVWNVADGKVAFRLAHGSRNYKDVAFSPDGRHLAYACNDKTVRLLAVDGWAEAVGFDWGLGPMISVAFAPDGMRAAGGSGRGKIVVWDVDL